ncbi:MAG: hypothetical protein ACQEXJ_20790 [Myxococcota bacterium]
MGLPVPNEPPKPLWPRLFEALPARRRTRFRVRFEQLVERGAEEPPAEGSPEETRWLLRLARLAHELLEELGVERGRLLTDTFEEMVADFEQREASASAARDRFSWRLLNQALEDYGAVVYLAAEAARDYPREDLVADLDEALALNADRDWVLAEPVAAVLRADSALLMAVVAAGESSDRFHEAARRALRATRRMLAQLQPAPLTGLRGELAARAARHTWNDWDEHDVATELAAWDLD